MKKHLTTIILVVVFFIGLSLLLYPKVADYWNSFHQSRAIRTYMADISNLDRSEYDMIINDGLSYNHSLEKNDFSSQLSNEDRNLYNSLLNYSGNGVMGYITIDKISVVLPLYHGTSEAVLQRSIGHLEGTSLPVGAYSWDSKAAKSGEGVTDPTDGSHCVLSGHRGLPSAKLFSDLDKLVEGDIFVLNILNETLTYQVDQIRVIDPSDVSELQIVPGKDYCTLVTCTPYGINTHRLLVRGHRVNNAQGDIKVVADAIQYETFIIAPFVGVPIILFLILIMILWTGRQKKRVQSRDLAFNQYSQRETIKVLETDLDILGKSIRLQNRNRRLQKWNRKRRG